MIKRSRNLVVKKKPKNNISSFFSSVLARINFLKKDTTLAKNNQFKENKYPKVKFYKKTANKNLEYKTTVFAPSESALLKAKLVNIDLKSEQRNKENNKFISFFSSWKDFSMVFSKSRQLFNFSNPKLITTNLKYLLNLILKINTLVSFTQMMSSLMILIIVISLIHFSFFDTNFLIKKWNIEYTNNSYVDENDLTQLIKNYEENRFFVFLPTSSYWFLTDYNLTSIAKSNFPYIENVKIIKRELNNSVTLQIETKPVLATLAILLDGNQLQYWQLDIEGKVIAKDSANIRQNVVYVDKVVSYDRPKATFKNINIFNQDKKQLDRLYFINTVKNLLSELNSIVDKVTIGSVNTADYEVNFFLKSGTKLMFDSSLLNKTSLIKRLNEIYKSNLKNDIEKGKIKYIDLRLSKNIYVCYNFLEC